MTPPDPFTLTPAEAESLRRELFGWPLSEVDRDNLEAISKRLGSPAQTDEDRNRPGWPTGEGIPAS